MHEMLLMPALRAYIVRHVSGPRCSDQIQKDQLPGSVVQFNKLISRIDPTGERFQPITPEEAAPLRDAGSYPTSPLGESHHAKQIATELSALRNADKSSAEWTAHYYEALKLLESGPTEEEASLDHFASQRTVEYLSLLDLLPAGITQRDTLESCLHFLEQQYAPAGDLDLWFSEFDLLLFGSRHDHGAAEQTWLLDELVHSRNPVISVYAQADKLFGLS
jgi:hypothetical protein